MKQKIALSIVLLLLISMLPVSASAEAVTYFTFEHYLDIDISYFGDNSELTLNEGVSAKLTNSSGSTYNNISIICKGNNRLTLQSVKIVNGSGSLHCALSFEGGVNELILESESIPSPKSYLKSSGIEPGIKVNQGCELTISGSGELEAIGSATCAGIGAGDGNNSGTIRITSGTITAKGSTDSAGIGAGYGQKCGPIYITGGHVTAIGGSYAAGIGGGHKGEQPSCIEITNATVIATGGKDGAGIGSGREPTNINTTTSSGILITNSNVTATGVNFAAGIGGGYYGDSGNIYLVDSTIEATGGGSPHYGGAGIGSGFHSSDSFLNFVEVIHISGGTVKATGKKGGAGIGAGKGAPPVTYITTVNSTHIEAIGEGDGPGIGGGKDSGSDISIISGRVEATGGSSSQYDIGDKNNNTALSISGSAIVFFKNNKCVIPTTDHTRYSINDISGGQKFGVPYPPGWSAGFGAYLKPVTLSYDTNGGTGAVPSDQTKHAKLTATIEDGSHITRDRYNNGGWNSKEDGTGTAYTAGTNVTLTSNLDLFIKWNEIPVSNVTLSSNTETMTHHDTVSLSATVLPSDATHPEVTWTSSDTSIATVDANGKITAVGVGSATITATADGVSSQCAVTVVKKAVTAVTLNTKSKTVNKGNVFTLTAIVTPSDATYPEVTWKSSDNSIATVSQNGKVNATRKGTVTITAMADGVSDTCVIKVKSKYAPIPKPEPTPIPTETPEPTETPKPTETSQPTETSNLNETPMTTDAPQDIDVPAKVVEENNEKNVIEINVADLPEGTEAVQTPSGDVIDLNGLDTVQIEILKEDINEDGTINITLLDNENVPYGSVTLHVQDQADDAKESKGILSYWWTVPLLIILIFLWVNVYKRMQVRKYNRDNGRR